MLKGARIDLSELLRYFPKRETAETERPIKR